MALLSAFRSLAQHSRAATYCSRPPATPAATFAKVSFSRDLKTKKLHLKFTPIYKHKNNPGYGWLLPRLALFGIQYFIFWTRSDCSTQTRDSLEGKGLRIRVAGIQGIRCQTPRYVESVLASSRRECGRLDPRRTDGPKMDQRWAAMHAAAPALLQWQVRMTSGASRVARVTPFQAAAFLRPIETSKTQKKYPSPNALRA